MSVCKLYFEKTFLKVDEEIYQKFSCPLEKDSALGMTGLHKGGTGDPKQESSMNILKNEILENISNVTGNVSGRHKGLGECCSSGEKQGQEGRGCRCVW